MTDSDATISPTDLAELNRAVIARSGAIARIGGSVLVGIGAVAAAGWLWFEARAQQQVSSGEFSFNLTSGSHADADLVDRIDLLVTSLSLLLTAALVVGLGLALRNLADYTQARTGTSLTGYDVGDPLDEIELQNE